MPERMRWRVPAPIDCDDTLVRCNGAQHTEPDSQIVLGLVLTAIPGVGLHAPNCRTAMVDHSPANSAWSSPLST